MDGFLAEAGFAAGVSYFSEFPIETTPFVVGAKYGNCAYFYDFFSTDRPQPQTDAYTKPVPLVVMISDK
jgi:hypothetical protein